MDKNGKAYFHAIYQSRTGCTYPWRKLITWTRFKFDLLSILSLTQPFFFLAANLVGQDLYDKISSASLKLYEEAVKHAQTRGVILADTKFEFEFVSSSNGSEEWLTKLLTSDSSRYSAFEEYPPGKAQQPSFDKQYVRDWLVKEAGFRKGFESGPVGKEGQRWFIDEEIVKGTKERFTEAVDLLTRK